MSDGSSSPEHENNKVTIDRRTFLKKGANLAAVGSVALIGSYLGNRLADPPNETLPLPSPVPESKAEVALTTPVTEEPLPKETPIPPEPTRAPWLPENYTPKEAKVPTEAELDLESMLRVLKKYFTKEFNQQEVLLNTVEKLKQLRESNRFDTENKQFSSEKFGNNGKNVRLYFDPEHDPDTAADMEFRISEPTPRADVLVINFKWDEKGSLTNRSRTDININRNRIVESARKCLQFPPSQLPNEPKILPPMVRERRSREVYEGLFRGIGPSVEGTFGTDGEVQLVDYLSKNKREKSDVEENRERNINRA
jgi:hypothetical protein